MLGNLGAADIDSRLEEQLIDGILFAFQEQTSEVSHPLSLSFSLSLSDARMHTFSSFSLLNYTFYSLSLSLC